MLAIAVLLFLFNHGEVFYIQNRIGYKNRTFGIIKFTSMLKNSHSLPGGTITMRDDPRVTTIGKILRRTKLNELPQIFNVLYGDMSFVGPRPFLEKDFNYFTPEVQTLIYKSKPGITGISSVVFRDEEKFVTESSFDPLEFYKSYIFPYKGELEKWYYANRSIKVDAKILFLTAFKILSPASTMEFRFLPTLPRSVYFN